MYLSKDQSSVIKYFLTQYVYQKVYLEANKHDISSSLNFLDAFEVDNDYISKLQFSHIQENELLAECELIADNIAFFVMRVKDLNYGNGGNGVTEFRDYSIELLENTFYDLVHQYFDEFPYQEISYSIDGLLKSNGYNMEGFLRILKEGTIILNIDLTELEKLTKKKNWIWMKNYLSLISTVIFSVGVRLSPNTVGYGVPVQVIYTGKVTSVQWALYHYILQSIGYNSWFTPGKKVKEIEDVAIKYRTSSRVFKDKYNEILISDCNEGYNENDRDMVERLLKAEHPEALEKFKEKTKAIF